LALRLKPLVGWSGLIAGKPAPTSAAHGNGQRRACRSGFTRDEARPAGRELTLTGVMEGDQQLIWASHYLSAMAKALLDDAELGMVR